jgi:hypothetical protein
LISQTTAAEKKATEATEKADAAACEAARAMEQILEMRLEINKANKRAEKAEEIAIVAQEQAEGRSRRSPLQEGRQRMLWKEPTRLKAS